MNLLSVTTSYQALEKKYNSFKAPTLEITVGGTKLVSSLKMSIQNLDIDLSSDYEASGCSFSIINAYEPSQTDFSKAANKIGVGDKVEVSIGYIRTENVFTGYINSIRYLFDKYSHIGEIRVECMDVKGLMMKNRRMEFFTQKSADGILKEILSASPVSSYVEGKNIDPCDEEEIPLRSNMQTDYEIMTEQASKLGYEFFVSQGKVVFRKKEKVTTPVMTLNPSCGIYELRAGYCAQQLVRKIEVRSVDAETGKLIKGEASISGKFSPGSGGSKVIGNSKQIFYEPGLKDAAEAKKRAQARIQAIEDTFGSLELTCIGIPEIGPGRFIRLEKIAEHVNGKYYITGVRHTMENGNFLTTFKARRNSL